MIIVKLIRVSGIPKIYFNEKMNIRVGNNGKCYDINGGVILIDEEFECEDLKFSQNECMDQVKFKISICKKSKGIEFSKVLSETPERHIIPVGFDESILNLVFEISKVNRIDNNPQNSKISFNVEEYVPFFLKCFSFV